MGLKTKSEKYVKLLIYSVVVVLVNLAGVTLFFRLDLTKNRVYSLSKSSKEVVSTLSDPLTINVFFTQNLPAPHNNTERYLKDLLEEYAFNANKYFNYRFYDVSPEDEGVSEKTVENRELAKKYGINPVQIRVVEKDEVKFKKAYMGLVIIHGDVIEKIPTITSTDGLEYKLTTSIRKLNNKVSALLRLKEKIHVKLFLSSSLKAVAPYINIKTLPDLPKEIEKAVSTISEKNYGKLDFQLLDPTNDATLLQEVQKYNVMNLQWPNLDNDQIQAGQGAIGLVLQYGEKTVTLPLIQVIRLPLIGTQYQLADLESLDETINNNIDSLIDINENIGYLSGHGSPPLSDMPMMNQFQQENPDTLSNFSALLDDNYTIKQINLKDSDIDDSLNCLIICRPTEAFTDYELYQIDQYLMKGKSLALFLDVFNEVMPQRQNSFYGYNQGPEYVPINTGLEKLLSFYGVKMDNAYVLDESCYKQVTPQQFGGGERNIYFAPIIKSENINNKLPFMRNIKGFVMLKISPLSLDEKRISENGLKVEKLFSSSDKSWEMKGRINLNPMFMQPPPSNEEKKSFPLAYLIEGEFPSYFAGKPVPVKEKKADEEKPEEAGKTGESSENAPKQDTADKKPSEIDKIKGEGEFIAKGKPGKIFLIASSEILKNNIIDTEGKSPNTTLVMNIIDDLNNRTAIAEMRSKDQGFNPLADSGPGTKLFIKFFNVIGLPILVVVFGLFVLLRRHSRKKQIKMMFQK